MTDYNLDNKMQTYLDNFLNSNAKFKKKPTLEELLIIADLKNYNTNEIAEYYNVKPVTVRSWKHKIKHNKY